MSDRDGALLAQVIYGEGSLLIPDGLSFSGWMRLGENLRAMERNVLWWLGDWWCYGERRYGESAAQAAPTGLATHTLQNAASVATTFSEPSRRRETLTFAHHAEVAGLPPAQQDHLLDRAVSEEWNRRTIRGEARKFRAQNELGVDPLAPRLSAVLPPGYEVRTGDFTTEQVDPGTVDAVVTDPPYGFEHLDLWRDLATWASKVLRPGGVLVAMSGQTYLPDVMGRVGEGAAGLEYRWALAYLTPGGQAVQVWPRQVNTFWKPVLLYSKGPADLDWFGDVVQSDTNDNDKRFHEWGQSESGMTDLVGRVTRDGWLVADPMCGAGTTGVAALRLGRRFLGIEKDPEKADLARLRLSKANDG